MKVVLIAGLVAVLAFLPAAAQEQADGVGSWYDDENTPGLFASHATFPFGTQVRVTNLENSRQITVQIGGRIPRDPRWIIDISRDAAYNIGMNGTGFTRVRIEEIPRENKPRVLRSTVSSMRRFFQNGRAEIWPDGASLTAGHPSLPMGTKLRITNRSNGMKIDVTVATRVRASQERIVLLSRSAAEQIRVGFARNGLSTADVTIESVE